MKLFASISLATLTLGLVPLMPEKTQAQYSLGSFTVQGKPDSHSDSNGYAFSGPRTGGAAAGAAIAYGAAGGSAYITITYTASLRWTGKGQAPYPASVIGAANVDGSRDDPNGYAASTGNVLSAGFVVTGTTDSGSPYSFNNASNFTSYPTTLSLKLFAKAKRINTGAPNQSAHSNVFYTVSGN